MTLDDLIKMIPALAGAGVAFAGVLVARRALSTWQRELRGKAEFDLARRTLLAVYTVRNAITHVRNDFAQDEIDARLARLRDARANLNLCLLESKVIWGDVLDEANKQLWEIEKAVGLAAIRVRRAEKDPKYNLVLDASGKWEQTHNTASGDEDDETGKAVSTAVLLFEEALRQHLPTRTDQGRGRRGRT